MEVKLKKMEVKQNKEKGKKLFRPRGEEYLMGSYHRTE
jgi:hypothetical protein